MEKKNHNRLAMQGVDIDDMEFVKEFGLPMSAAYTPKINIEMLNHSYNQNVKGFMEIGMTEAQAKTEAGKIRARVKKDISQL